MQRLAPKKAPHLARRLREATTVVGVHKLRYLQCPLWVISGSSADSRWMSAPSQERTFRLAVMTPLRRESTCGGNSNSWEVLPALRKSGPHTTMGGEGVPRLLAFHPMAGARQRL